jgi:hypothetical protein
VWNAVNALHAILAYHVIVVQEVDDLIAYYLDTIHVIDIGRNDLACFIERYFRTLVKRFGDAQATFSFGEGLAEQFTITTAQELLTLHCMNLQVYLLRHVHVPGLNE